MSFTDKAKSAVCSSVIKKHCCKVSFLYGYLFSRDSFSENKITVTFESDVTGDFFRRIFYDAFSINLESGKKIFLDDEFTVSLLYGAFMCDTDIFSLSDVVYVCENCAKSFIKGVFLGCGTICDPTKSYRLEFMGKSERIQKELYSFFDWQGIGAKKYIRKGRTVLYYNNADIIETMLGYIGAGKVVFDYINARMTGEERTSIIRKLNFETANMNKTASATASQLSAIRALESSGRFSLLPEELKYTAKLRTENPDASFAALASLHEPPITKSGLTHRLFKIIAFSKEEK